MVAFINQINILESRAKAILSDTNDGSWINPVGKTIQGFGLRYKNNETTTDIEVISIVPAINLEAGAVFRMGQNLKLIPKINLGFFLRDDRVRNGTLLPRTNSLNGDIQLALQLSYVIL